MAIATVNGLSLGYDIIGDSGPSWVLTPGGRFSKDTPGIRDMATDLAGEGYRVLIWDRPNCGESDVCFEGSSESAMQADYLAALLQHLDLAPAVIAGGSAGARVSLHTAARHPEVARALALWWITGGVNGLVTIANYYCGRSLKAAWNIGMEAVVELDQWREVIERNPANRQRFLDQDREEFMATFQRWMKANLSSDDEIVPGLLTDDARRITLPTVVVRSHSHDADHPQYITEWVADVVPNSTLIEWPWPDDGALEREAFKVGYSPLFPRWRALVPSLHEWAAKSSLP
jgi:pimeloyl-ACP methyl ester carboxylesterase